MKELSRASIKIFYEIQLFLYYAKQLSLEIS